MKDLRAVLLAMILVTLACEDSSGPDASGFGLQLDLRAMTGAALGDAASVLERITLSVSLPNQDITVFTQDFNVAPTDSMVETIVDIEPGPYSFAVNAFSNNGATIYFMSTVAFLGEGSTVVLVPQATNAVLVVGPADAEINEHLLVRNVGISTLNWVATCQPGQADCRLFYAFPMRGTLGPGQSISVSVCSAQRAGDVFTIRFFSQEVGSVTVRKTAPILGTDDVNPCP